MHFTGLFSTKPNAIPIVMVHGWPGSFLEYLGVLSILKDRYTSETLPYHIIIPSLPGFAFSSKPPMERDFCIEDASRIINTLMVQLGFGSGYVIQGGDLGSIVACELATNYKECKGMWKNKSAWQMKLTICNSASSQHVYGTRAVHCHRRSHRS